MPTIDTVRRLELVPAPNHDGGRIDRGAAQRAVADLLAALGFDAHDEGLRETPRRMVEAYGAAADAPKPVTRTVTIEATSFQPSMLTVKAGDSVVWVNKDPFPHTATSEAGRFDSGVIAPDKSWTYTPKTKGEFAYLCTLHLTMKAFYRF